MKPDEHTRWESVKLGIWNPDTQEFFGRTAKSWGGIVLFYMIFFSALAALFAICMYGLLSCLSDQYPRYQLESSLIGTNPGLGFRPVSNDVEKHGSLIWYVASNETNIVQWTGVLDEFLHDYTEIKERENRVMCDFDSPPNPGKVCSVNVNDFGPCTKDKGYSYNNSAPCIFIKLNRIYNWAPEFFNDTVDLPEDMDDDLKAHISVTPPSQRNLIWISCYGENPADRENIGPIEYIPQRGFPGYYYPYVNTPGYLSPLVAIHFERPKLHTLINIECRAWAKNIEYKRALQHREGSVHFELMID